MKNANGKIKIFSETLAISNDVWEKANLFDIAKGGIPISVDELLDMIDACDIKAEYDPNLKTAVWADFIGNLLSAISAGVSPVKGKLAEGCIARQTLLLALGEMVLSD